MKACSVIICCLCWASSLWAEDVDQVIRSYAGNRKEFDWARLEKVDRAELIARLNDLRTRKTDTVAGGYIIGSRTAERMLVEIGDEATVEEVLGRYHRTKNPGPANIVDVVQVGQAMAIPYLAVDLVSDKFLTYDVQKSDGSIITVKDTHETGKRLSSARNIIGIIENSRQFTPSVQESATRIKPTRNSSREEFISQVADWWRQNEQLLLARRYAEVSPFAPVGYHSHSTAAVTTFEIKQNSQTKEPAHTPLPEIAESSPARGSNARWLWISAVVVLLLIVAFFGIKRR